MIDLRAAAMAVTLIAASIVVAFADDAKPQAAAAMERTADGQPIRVILAAPWEPALSPGASARPAK